MNTFDAAAALAYYYLSISGITAFLSNTCQIINTIIIMGFYVNLMS